MEADEQEIVAWGRWRIAWVDSRSGSACHHLLETGRIDGVGISPYRGFSGADASVLLELPNLKGVVVPDARSIDVSCLTALHGLLFLTLGEVRQPVDLSSFALLQELRLQWTPAVSLPPDGQPCLRELVLAGYTAESGDVRELPAYPLLDRLALTQCEISSLDGVERLSSLRCAEFNYLTRLRFVSALAHTRIEDLVFEGCRRIADLHSLADLHTLTTLKLIHCGRVPNLGFFRKIRRFVVT